MICPKCRENNHIGCPSNLALDPNKPSMGLSPECEKIQVAGLCTCQHRAPRDHAAEYVVLKEVALRSSEHQTALQDARDKMKTAGVTPVAR